MKKIVSTFLLLACLLSANAQSSDSTTTQKIGGYRIEQDEVVFVFNPNDHNDYLTSYGMWKSKPSIKIKTVTLCGEFNSWNTGDKLYLMKAVGNNYEYRMKLADFKGKSKIEFKYVVNKKYWAEPNNYFSNLTQSLMEYTNPKNFVLNLVQP
jgi:major membrane immunogen (membrane-anchored lipoprotein)